MPPLKKDDSSDFRKYLDERFNSLHFRLDTITKNQEDTDLSVKELFHIVDTVRQVDAAKCVSCINTKDLKEVKKNVDEVMFIKKYYKPFLLAAAFTVLGIIYTGREMYDKVMTMIEIETAKSDQQKIEILKKVDENTKGVNSNSNVINNNAEIQQDQLEREKQRNTK